jgi:hypothetical protein
MSGAIHPLPQYAFMEPIGEEARWVTDDLKRKVSAPACRQSNPGRSARSHLFLSISYIYIKFKYFRKWMFP